MRRRPEKRKWLKRTLLALLILVLLIVAAFSVFLYKVKNGFPIYEDDAPVITFPENQKRILLFSKANGFVHGEAISAAKPVFRQIAGENNWFLFEFDEGGVFNEEQLNEFDLVIWNNVSGKVLTNDQRSAFQHYIENGGSFIGLHAAGDDSHHWDWYTQNLIGAQFSHHPIEHQLQQADLVLQPTAQGTVYLKELPESFTHTDEWYVFFQNPEEKGFKVLYEMDGNAIDPNGNMLWIKNKDFGMGEHHPNIWYKRVGKGKTFYSGLGHNAAAYSNQAYLEVLESMMTWSIN